MTQPLIKCDARCPAAALVHVEKNGNTLSFCGRCFDVRTVALFAQGFQVRNDERPALRRAERNR